MTDVLLIQPPIRDFYLTAKRTLPTGLASVAGALRAHGFSVAMIDALASRKSRPRPRPDEMAYLDPFYGTPDRSPVALFHGYYHFGYAFDHIGRLARAAGAPLVGISALFTAYADDALETARAVKAHHPDCAVVVGGHHATALPAEVMACRAVDYVLRGEGEVGMPILAERLRSGWSLADVPGIVYRHGDGTLHQSSPAAMADLDEAPPPAIDLIDPRRYRRKGRGSVVAVTSRGCPLRCTYCCFGGDFPPYRRRSASAAVDEITRAAQMSDAGFIDFEDENLSLDRGWVLELLDGLRSRLGPLAPELRAMNGLYPPSLTEPVIRAMRDAGFRTLNLSVGSMDEAQLRRFGRPDVRAGWERVLALTGAAGMGAVSYLIVGAPDQPPTVSLADLCHLAARPTLVGISVFYPAPGSADYARCEAAGLLPPSFARMRASAIPIEHLTDRRASVTLLRLGRIVNFMKALAADGDLPDAASGVPARLDPGDRRAAGIAILRTFLKDGRIRGVTPTGEVFEHEVDRDLTRMFLEARPAVVPTAAG